MTKKSDGEDNVMPCYFPGTEFLYEPTKLNIIKYSNITDMRANVAFDRQNIDDIKPPANLQQSPLVLLW